MISIAQSTGQGGVALNMIEYWRRSAGIPFWPILVIGIVEEVVTIAGNSGEPIITAVLCSDIRGISGRRDGHEDSSHGTCGNLVEQFPALNLIGCAKANAP